MKVSTLKGLANERAVQPPDAVVSGTNAPTARQRSFQQKIALADERLRRPRTGTNETGPREQVAGRRAKPSQAAPTTRLPPQQVPPSRTRDARGAEHAKQIATLSAAATRRLRRFRKQMPRKLRDRIFRLTTDLGLCVVDVWSDASKHSVTLIVDQSGYSTTRLVIEYRGSAWQVGIRAAAETDTKTLLAEERQLQQRFSNAGLGRVTVGDL